jgi:Leucine-rich repeat (LRR) protein
VQAVVEYKNTQAHQLITMPNDLLDGILDFLSLYDHVVFSTTNTAIRAHAKKPESYRRMQESMHYYNQPARGVAMPRFQDFLVSLRANPNRWNRLRSVHGEIPEEDLAHLIRLNDLLIVGHSIGLSEYRFPLSLTLLSSLEVRYLMLKDCRSIGALSTLRNLRIDMCDVRSLSGLEHLVNLESFVLRLKQPIQKLKQELLRLEQLPKLKTLGLRIPGMKSLTVIAGCVQLQTLALLEYDAGAPVSIQDLWVLEGFTHLVNLRLQHINIKDLSLLVHTPGLTKLELSQCDELTDVSALTQLTTLTTLHIFYCAKLKDVSPLAQCNWIRTFIMEQHCIRDLTPLNGLKQLECLHIGIASSCNSIEFVRGMPNLRKLEICNDWVLRAIDLTPLRECRKLTSLYIEDEWQTQDNMDFLLSMQPMYFQRDKGDEFVCSMNRRWRESL